MRQGKLFYEEQNGELTPECKSDLGKKVRNESYNNLTARHLGKCQQLVYEALSEESLTDSELSERTGLRRSSVNGRRNELVSMGLVIASHRKTIRDNGRKRVNTVWRIK